MDSATGVDTSKDVRTVAGQQGALTPEHKALVAAEASFEKIRRMLVNLLSEPGCSAFWEAVVARDKIRAVLESLSAQGEADAVGVRPLEWKTYNDPSEGRTHYGHGVLGHWYGVHREKTGVWTTVHHIDGTPIQLPLQPSIDAAKAAAQADYEQRIRSCLVAAPAPVPDAVKRAIVEAMMWMPSEYGPTYKEVSGRLYAALASNMPVEGGLPEGTLSRHGNDVVIAYSHNDDAHKAFDILEAMLAASGESGR